MSQPFQQPHPAPPPAGTGPAPGYPPPTSPHRPWALPAAQLPGPPPAGYGARAGAYVVDLLLVVAMFLIVFYGGMFLVIDLTGAQGQQMEDAPEPAIAMVLLIPGTMLLAFAYFWLMHAHSGRTVGKLLFGIKVISIQTGERPSPGLAAGRVLVHWGLSWVGCVGWFLDVLWPLWDEPYRQAVHDKAVRTRVVRVRGSQTWDPPPYPQPPAAPPQSPPQAPAPPR
ncbi:RDD family protein [Lipingzhangella sp. LS1_29]|uniref:RDD family protein n=1 Tax=Lipingzhangella rawalii TaxID=2055835 RepID=A0ABU2H473_9ACTN|nr:RDD family protein [Lipingzhangella rawalii]MDS1269630.1 RDD family protein [Lipingzhangella rawalii]